MPNGTLANGWLDRAGKAGSPGAYYAPGSVVTVLDEDLRSLDASGYLERLGIEPAPPAVGASPVVQADGSVAWQVITPGVGTQYVAGLIGNRPTPVAFGNGWYFATDDQGGTLYRSDGATWAKQAAPVGWASGTRLAYSPDPTLNFDAKAVAGVATDLSAALRITVPASSVPVKIRGKVFGSAVTGTAAAGQIGQPTVSLTDNAGNALDFDVMLAVQPAAGVNQGPPVSLTTASKTLYKTYAVEVDVAAPFAGGTFKLRGYMLGGVPAGWNAASMFGGGVWPVPFIEAVAL